MELPAVRAAYSALAGPYIAMTTGGWHEHDDDTALVRDHLTGLDGPVLDLGCGPGHWSGYLHALGADVTGVDAVPAFVVHARASHPGPMFELGSMTELGLPARAASGVLSWYSTIHLPPSRIDPVLAEFRRLLRDGGSLVLGFFDSDDEVAPFDHRVLTAYRWPADVLSARLSAAGLTEVQRVQHSSPDRPDRRYAALALRAS